MNSTIRIVAWLVAAGVAGATALAQDLSGAGDIAKLNRKSSTISETAARQRIHLQKVLIRGVAPPRLAGMGALALGATLKDVTTKLGQPKVTTVGEGEVRTLTYVRLRGVLSVGLNARGLVSYITTSSGEIAIPKELRVGMLLEQFEGIYGGPKLRSSEAFSLGKRLVKYPVSHLALVVRSEGNLVDAIMVFE